MFLKIGKVKTAKVSAKSNEDLIALLSTGDGWQRDIAQRCVLNQVTRQLEFARKLWFIQGASHDTMLVYPCRLDLLEQTCCKLTKRSRELIPSLA